MRALAAIRNAPVRIAVRLHGDGDREAGMTTAEYAVGTVAACGFGGVLWTVIQQPEVSNALGGLLHRALSWVTPKG